jgi:hypothetical protein
VHKGYSEGVKGKIKTQYIKGKIEKHLKGKRSSMGKLK